MDKDRKLIKLYLAPSPNWRGGYHEKDTIFITKGVAGCVDSTFYKHGWKILRYANNQVLHNERPKVDGNDTP